MRWVNNFNELARSPLRDKALQIAEAGLDAVHTETVIHSSILLSGEKLRIKNHSVNLKGFKRVRIIGFGKASCEAALTLEKILGKRIRDGVVIDVKTAKCEFIISVSGSHPRPSPHNVLATKNILDLASETEAGDLILAIVSGGGSALLCGDDEECRQGERLYDEFLKTGGNVSELNVIRKHISSLKGGGLAKLFYPATVVGLIFSDVPGGMAEDVASGPTFKDRTTVADAEAVLMKYGLSGFKLRETSKDDKYFEKVTNIVLVSNEDALRAMAEKARELGFKPEIISASLYETADETVKMMGDRLGPHKAILGGGEISISVEGYGGKGGRCGYLAVKTLPHIGKDEIFLALASDGLDNSDAAGGIIDEGTLIAAERINLSWEEYVSSFNSYDFLQKTGDLIFTGATGANVSDLMLWLKQK